MPNLFGLCDPDNHIIYISTYVNGKTTTETQRFSSLIHEIGHAVLHTMGLPDNERLVSGVEELVLQIILTMRTQQQANSNLKK